MSRGRGVRIVAGSWRGRRLVELEGREIRPTTDRVREAWMSSMGGRFDGMRVLDLFAGTGALGLECLSRGAAHVTFVESSADSLEVLRANLELLEPDPARFTVVQADAIAWVAGADAESLPDLALADPPYDGGWHRALTDRYEARPFAAALWVEHRSTDPLDSPFVVRSRTYGGTTVTTLVAPEDLPRANPRATSDDA